MEASNGLDLQIFVSIWNRDIGNDTVGGQPSFDLFLWRNIDRNVTFHNSLTGKRITLSNVCFRESECASSPGASLRYLYRTASAAPLPSSGLTDFNARQARGIRQQGIGGNGNRSQFIVKGEGDVMLHGSE